MYACFVYTYVIKKEKEPREEGKEKKRRTSKLVASFPLLPLLVDLLKNYYFVTYYGFDDPNFKLRHCALPGFFLSFSLSFLYKIRLQLPSGNLIVIII